MAMATISLSLFFFSLLFFASSTSSAGIVGVNYGRVANNLPSPSAVVSLLKSSGVAHVKLYDSDPAVLHALAGTGVSVTVALPNENLTAAALSPSFASLWVRQSVAAYLPATRISAVAVGNEVFAVSNSTNNLTSSLVPAMLNILSALSELGLDKSIKISSPIALTALQASYPSSAGSFRPDIADSVMKPMLDLITKTESFLMVNAYPFFAYESNSDVISLDYALFRPNPGIVDAGSELKYYSLLDAQIDAVFAATKRLGFEDVKMVISETGWPSKGDEEEIGVGIDNAEAYNGNLVRRVLSGNGGTPMKPQADIDVYLFALFNENQKPGPTSERNYGLFYPNQEKVYDVNLALGSGSGSGGLKWEEASGGRKSSSSSSSISSSKSSNNNGGRGPSTSTTAETWCVANAMVGKERLQRALDYACGEGGADCEKIQPGKDCYDPDTLEAHASFAFNSYYQKKGRLTGTCDFHGAAYVVTQSPKIGKCELPTKA